jgi:hypothetical protein
MLRHYDIRAFSDPLNWLHFARHFGTEIHISKFALGFAVFLRAALDLVGPFYVFLVNLPVLMAVYLMASALVVRAFRPEDRPPRWQVVAVTLALFFSFDRWLVVQMVNPFRDPLSFLLVLGSAGLLTGHAATGETRPARVAASGLLLGLACSVRETSVLLLGPFALYAFWSWRADARIRFGRDAFLFIACFFAGLGPLMIQGWLSTGQALLPPQSTVESKLVPGVHFTWACMRGTMQVAGPYFLRMAGIGLLLLAGSAVWGIWRRNRIIAGLLLPAALVHVVFYAFYWTFVPRYFYAAAVFAVPVAVWGLLLAIRSAAKRMSPRYQATASSIAVGTIALVAALRLLCIQPDYPRFQIPQARQFAADLQQRLPENSLVLCRRHMCEMVEWFVGAEAFPATALIPADVPAEAAMQQALAPYLADSRPLFILEMKPAKGWEVDAALLSRICRLDLVDLLPTERYHLVHEAGPGGLRLFRVNALPPLPEVLPGIEQARREVARFDFALNAVPLATSALSGNVAPPTLERIAPRVGGNAAVTLPGPIGTGETAYAEFRLCSPERADAPLNVVVSLGGSSRTLRLRQNRGWHVFAISVEGPLEQPVLEFQTSASFDLHWVDWSIPQPMARLKVDVGANGDVAHLREGWFDREMTPDGTARWTGPVASLVWRCASPVAPGRITLRHVAQSRPADAPPPRIWCNEVELRAKEMPDAESGFATLAADIQAGLLKVENDIRIESEGWQPGGKDSRTLGIFVDWILLDAGTSTESRNETEGTP